MTKASNRLTSLLRPHCVAGPARVRSLRARSLRPGGLLRSLYGCAPNGVLTIASTLLLTAVLSASAQAEITHEYLPALSEEISKGVPATCSQPHCLTGPLGEVSSMTVDSGHLFVAEQDTVESQGQWRLDEFEGSSGVLLSQLSHSTAAEPGPTTRSGVAVEHSTGVVYAREEGGVAVFSEAGALLGTWTGADTESGFFGSEINSSQALAVDNKASGLGDWAAGDVYVVSFPGAVEVFKPKAGKQGEETTPVTQITGTCAAEHTTCSSAEMLEHPLSGARGVSVDESNGDVLVASGSLVDVFKPVEPLPGVEEYEFVTQIVGPSPTEPFAAQLDGVAVDGGAVDGSDIYVFEELSATIDEFRFTGVADESTEYVGHLTGFSGGLRSAAVDPASGDLYVGQDGVVKKYGPDIVVPDVTVTEPVSNLTPTSAVLRGTLNPDEAGEATCEFEYGTSTSYGSHAHCEGPGSEATPILGGPTEDSPVPVKSVEVTGLQPDTTYYYRTDATNNAGKATSAGSCPADCGHFTASGTGIHSASISDVASTSATLQAAIDPNDAPTTYYFQYVEAAHYAPGAEDPYAAGFTAPVEPGEAIGFGTEDVLASQHIDGLSAGTVYHYRVVALSELKAGQPTTAFYGPDRTFTTQTAGAFTLPDGRSWEMVSPPDKHGALIETISGSNYAGLVTEAATDADAFTFLTSAPTESEPAGFVTKAQVLATRGLAGWQSRDIGAAHDTPVGAALSGGEEYRLFSEDLSLGGLQPEGAFTPSLSAQATEQTPYLRNDALTGELCTSTSGCYTPLVTRADDTAESFQPFGEEGKCPKDEKGKGGARLDCGPKLVGATPDASHIVLEANVQLTSTPPNPGTFYEWSGGELQPLYFLPASEGGAAVEAGELSDGEPVDRHQLSNDGSVFFSYGGHLYLHDFAKDDAVRLDVAQGVAEPTEGAADFLYASSDGSTVLFEDSQQLTRVPGGGIYECRIVEPAGVPACELELTGLPGVTLVGGSQDASYLYFIGAGDTLIVDHYNGREWTSTQGPVIPQTPRSGFLVSPQIPSAGPSKAQPYRISSNGRFIAFMSNDQLTGYDNRDAASDVFDEEVYLYDAVTGKLACASCNPTGARPVGVASENMVAGIDGGGVPKDEWISGSVPEWPVYAPSVHGNGFGTSLYQSRYLSDSGRLFFNSADALVPDDVNATGDVYEYEPEGVPASEHACAPSSTSGSDVFKPARTVEVAGATVQEGAGCVALISSGTSSEESGFLDASQTGGDVFFFTTAKLSLKDTDDSRDVYDAHECTSQSPCGVEPASPPPPCTTEASCKASPTPQPSIYGAPSSAMFSGTGNLTPPPPAVVKAKTAAQIRAEKLTKALKACKKDKKKPKRQKCEKSYGAAKAKRATNDRRASQ